MNSPVTADVRVIEAMALGIINAARERWSLEPITWDFPALSSEHRDNALRQARGAYAALTAHTALDRGPVDAWFKAHDAYHRASDTYNERLALIRAIVWGAVEHTAFNRKVKAQRAHSSHERQEKSGG